MKTLLLLTLLGLSSLQASAFDEIEQPDDTNTNEARFNANHHPSQYHHHYGHHAGGHRYGYQHSSQKCHSSVCHFLHRLHALVHTVLHKYVEHTRGQNNHPQSHHGYGKYYYSHRLQGTQHYRSFWHKINEWYKKNGHASVNHFIENLFKEFHQIQHHLHRHGHNWKGLKMHLHAMLAKRSDKTKHMSNLKAHVRFIGEYLHHHRCM